MKILDLKQQQQQQQRQQRQQQEQQLFRRRLKLQRLGQAGANRASGHSCVTFFIRDDNLPRFLKLLKILLDFYRTFILNISPYFSLIYH